MWRARVRACASTLAPCSASQPPLGLLLLLDEETNFPKGTDQSLVAKFRAKHEQHPNFSKVAAKKQADATFAVVHFPGEVVYSAEGFLVRNRDAVRPELVQLLASSESTFVGDQLATDPDVGRVTPLAAGADARRPMTPGAQTATRTVCGSFVQSLNDLIAKLSACHCYFVRCVKPNNTKAPGTLELPLVLDQLRYLGILETVRLRQLGYSLRLTFAEFIVRYKCLQPSINLAAPDPVAAVRMLLAIAGPADSGIAMGKQRVFLRVPAEAIMERAVRRVQHGNRERCADGAQREPGLTLFAAWREDSRRSACASSALAGCLICPGSARNEWRSTPSCYGDRCTSGFRGGASSAHSRRSGTGRR